MEIYGIGTDIIEIERIKEAINRTVTFKQKVYSEKVRKKKSAGTILHS